MFDAQEIVTLSGSTIDEVRTLTPYLLQTIRDYTNRSFITLIGVIDDISITDENTISLLANTFENFVVGDTIEIRYSENNKFVYTIATISEDNKSITTNEKIYAEEVYGVVIKLSIPIHSVVLSDMIKYRNTSKQGLISESLDGYSYTLESSSFGGFPKSILSNFAHLKQLPDSMEREYRNAGFNIYDIQRYRIARDLRIYE